MICAACSFKGVLAGHWGLDRTDLERTVFPGAGARPFEGLIL